MRNGSWFAGRRSSTSGRATLLPSQRVSLCQCPTNPARTRVAGIDAPAILTCLIGRASRRPIRHRGAIQRRASVRPARLRLRARVRGRVSMVCFGRRRAGTWPPPNSAAGWMEAWDDQTWSSAAPILHFLPQPAVAVCRCGVTAASRPQARFCSGTEDAAASERMRPSRLS